MSRGPDPDPDPDPDPGPEFGPYLFATLFIKSNEKIMESSFTEFNSNPGIF